MDYEVINEAIEETVADFNRRLVDAGINIELASLDDMFERFLNVRKDNINLISQLTVGVEKYRNDIRAHYDKKMFEVEYISFEKLRNMSLQEIAYILEEH